MAVYGSSLGDSRPTNHQRCSRTVVVKLCFGERQWHSVVGEEKDNRVICLLAFVQRSQDFSDGIIGPSYRRVIAGQFFPNDRIVGQKSRNRNLVSRVNLRRDMWVISSCNLTKKRLVWIGYIDDQAKRFPGCLGLANSLAS